jgi:hypothetical protein
VTQGAGLGSSPSTWEEVAHGSSRPGEDQGWTLPEVAGLGGGGGAEPAQVPPAALCPELTLPGDGQAEQDHAGDGAILQNRPRLQDLCVERGTQVRPLPPAPGPGP